MYWSIYSIKVIYFSRKNPHDQFTPSPRPRNREAQPEIVEDLRRCIRLPEPRLSFDQPFGLLRFKQASLDWWQRVPFQIRLSSKSSDKTTGADFVLIICGIVFCFLVWGTFPCNHLYLCWILELNGAKIYHCSVCFSMVFIDLPSVFPWCYTFDCEWKHGAKIYHVVSSILSSFSLRFLWCRWNFPTFNRFFDI